MGSPLYGKGKPCTVGIHGNMRKVEMRVQFLLLHASVNNYTEERNERKYCQLLVPYPVMF